MADGFASMDDAKTRARSFAWSTPLDFFADQDTPAPVLQQHHVPVALWGFVSDLSARLGVDPTSVALSCLVACASVISDTWSIQPKRHDTSWTENPRLWGAIVGAPSILKTPVINACTRPIDRLDAEARKRHQEAMREHKTALARWKASDDKGIPEPTAPRLGRFLVEGATVEALSEVLRDDDEAKQFAPAGKVLSRHDEMSEFFANLDRYRNGGKGGGDRGAFLRLYNGGRYTIDRIGRGSFAVPNWSACFLGGIQPGPIQRIAKEADDDGLLQRPIYAVPGEQVRGLDRAPDARACDLYDALIPKLAEMRQHRMIGDSRTAVVLHEEAHQHREDVNAIATAMAALPDTSPRLKSAFEKWPGLFARLTLTFHLIEAAAVTVQGGTATHLAVVSSHVAQRVADFMIDIVLPHALRADALMFNTTQSGHAAWIAGYILAKRLDRITTRDVIRVYNPLKPPETRKELAAVMASLVSVNWLEPEEPSSPVKPVSSWQVNPGVHQFTERAAQERQRRAEMHEKLQRDIEAVRVRRRQQ